jgi:mannose-6-phosphate isomerase-like protein (cupin superfamily)
MILPLLLLLAYQPPMFENEAVQVHMAVDQPHSKSALHKHDRDRVMIYLNDGHMRIENQGGKVENQTWKAGQVAFSPAGGMHTSENIDGSVLRIIEIELKPRPAAKPVAMSPLDPVNVDPKRYTMEFENDKVRVFRGKYGPHQEGVMHDHFRDRVVVYLSTGKLGVTTPDGRTETKQLEAGTVSWGGPAKHRESVGDSPIEMVVVELKAR